jgi:hypothetical protein
LRMYILGCMVKSMVFVHAPHLPPMMAATDPSHPNTSRRPQPDFFSPPPSRPYLSSSSSIQSSPTLLSRSDLPYPSSNPSPTSLHNLSYTPPPPCPKLAPSGRSLASPSPPTPHAPNPFASRALRRHRLIPSLLTLPRPHIGTSVLEVRTSFLPSADYLTPY